MRQRLIIFTSRVHFRVFDVSHRGFPDDLLLLLFLILILLHLFRHVDELARVCVRQIFPSPYSSSEVI